MNKVEVLCAKDRMMMHAFSRRSLHALHARSLLSSVLALASSYLDGNVKKEADKDALIIREAAAAYAAGRPLCGLDLEDIFEKTKKIDKTFIDGLLIPSLTLSVRYSEFADIRIRRIWSVGRTVYALLDTWSDTASFSDAVRTCYTEKEFRRIVSEILHLYSLETRMLGGSIRSPFHDAIQNYLQSLFEAMESVRDELASNCSRMIFGEKAVHA